MLDQDILDSIDEPRINLTDNLTTDELRHLISMAHQHVHPDFIFLLLFQCRRLVKKHGASWSELGTTDLELRTLLYSCQINQIIKELRVVLAENQKRPLNSEDARKLWCIIGEFENHGSDWSQLPISSDGLLTIIELAESGYEHLAQIA